MNEIIIVGGVNYATTKVTTGMNTISFTLSDIAVNDAYAVFKTAESLKIAGEEDVVYGLYSDVKFDHLTIYDNGTIIVTMRIPTELEKRISALELSQTEQDEVIAEMLYGGGDTNE